MKKNADEVKTFFDSSSMKWDEIYSEKGTLYTWLNKHFRKGVYRRSQRVMEIIRERKDHINYVLDVGCGSGRLALELCQMGITVTGLDFSPSMIEIANNLAREWKLSGNCTFVVGDFIEYPFTKKTFDISVAMGVLDYVSNAKEFLAKMKSISSNMVIVTFPIKGTPRSLLRGIRLRLKHCPVYFYSKEMLSSLLTDLNYSQWTIEKIYNQYFVIAKP